MSRQLCVEKTSRVVTVDVGTITVGREHAIQLARACVFKRAFMSNAEVSCIITLREHEPETYATFKLNSPISIRFW